MTPWIVGLLILFVKLLVVLVGLLLTAAYLVLLERKFLGRLQIRYGPNRAGRYGLLQPLADTIKMLTKEDVVPEAADRVMVHDQGEFDSPELAKVVARTARSALEKLGG